MFMSDEIAPAEILEGLVLNPGQRLIIRVSPRTTQAAAQALFDHVHAAGIKNLVIVVAEEIVAEDLPVPPARNRAQKEDR